MYFHSVVSATVADTYAVQQIAELTGPVDPAALRARSRPRSRRHDALRACFRELRDGRIVQVICGRRARCRGASTDVCRRPRERLAEIAAAELAAAVRPGRTRPLLRYALVSLERHRAPADRDHAPHPRRRLVVPADLLRRRRALQRRRRSGDRPAPAVTLPRPRRGGRRPATATPPARPGRPPWPASSRPLLFPDAEHGVGEHDSAVRRLSARPDRRADRRPPASSGVTLSTLVHGAWGLLLGRLLGRDRVVFGSTVSGRGGELPGVESIVGLLINTVPVPMSWRPDDAARATCCAACRSSRPTCSTSSSWAWPSWPGSPGSASCSTSMVVVENFPAVDGARDAAGLACGASPARTRRTTRCRWWRSPASG